MHSAHAHTQASAYARSTRWLISSRTAYQNWEHIVTSYDAIRCSDALMLMPDIKAKKSTSPLCNRRIRIRSMLARNTAHKTYCMVDVCHRIRNIRITEPPYTHSHARIGCVWMTLYLQNRVYYGLVALRTLLRQSHSFFVAARVVVVIVDFVVSGKRQEPMNPFQRVYHLYSL